MVHRCWTKQNRIFVMNGVIISLVRDHFCGKIRNISILFDYDVNIELVQRLLKIIIKKNSNEILKNKK